MALGKLLVTIIFISFASNVAHAGQWDKPIYQNEINDFNSPALIFNAYRSMFSRLNKEDSRKHQQAVFFALNRLDNGETTKWYSEDGYHMGQVQVMVTAMINGEMCRRIYSVILLKSDQRTFEEWACFKTSSNTWNFTDK